MPALRCDPRALHWSFPGGPAGSFRPNGKLVHVSVHHPDAAPNPRRFEQTGKMLAARLFVGFNVGGRPKWKIGDVIRIVSRVRGQQDRDPDASFISQKGIYTSRDSGKTVVENGVQIILIDMAGDSLRAFQAQMEELAESVARELKQELVILEIQRAGLNVRTLGIGP
jgi:hypothetical protein